MTNVCYHSILRWSLVTPTSTISENVFVFIITSCSHILYWSSQCILWVKCPGPKLEAKFWENIAYINISCQHHWSDLPTTNTTEINSVNVGYELYKAGGTRKIHCLRQGSWLILQFSCFMWLGTWGLFAPAVFRFQT